MADDNRGQEILKGLSETRAFFVQVSALIETAGGLLGKNGWNAQSAKKCAEVEESLFEPEEWMPRFVYRFFRSGEDDEEHEKHSSVFLFVGVLFDHKKAWQGFKEPWVTCGLYKYGTVEQAKEFKYWGEWVRAPLDTEIDPDGQFLREERTPENEQEWGGLIYQSFMALPLVEIGNEEDLQRKVVGPLLDEVSRIPSKTPRKKKK